MTYFRTGTPYYHRRAAVSRSCSGWEGVVPAGYGRQALRGESRGVVAVPRRDIFLVVAGPSMRVGAVRGRQGWGGAVVLGLS